MHKKDPYTCMLCMDTIQGAAENIQLIESWWRQPYDESWSTLGGSENGRSPVQPKAITWTSVASLLICTNRSCRYTSVSHVSVE